MSIIFSLSVLLQVYVTHVETRWLVLVRPVRPWATSITPTALYVVHVAERCGGRPSTMCMAKCTVRRTTSTLGSNRQQRSVPSVATSSWRWQVPSAYLALHSKRMQLVCWIPFTGYIERGTNKKEKECKVKNKSWFLLDKKHVLIVTVYYLVQTMPDNNVYCIKKT